MFVVPSLRLNLVDHSDGQKIQIEKKQANLQISVQKEANYSSVLWAEVFSLGISLDVPT